jgi:flagellar basal body-associated protein FliL
MIFQNYFQFMDIWAAVEMGLYFMVIGYYVLLFAYFGLIKYRSSKKLYWLFFAVLAVMLALGRIFFISYYFFIPELAGIGFMDPEIGALLMVSYRIATFFTWMGITCIVGVLGILLLPIPVDTDRKFEENGGIKIAISKFFNSDKKRRISQLILLIIPVVIGILALVLPDTLFMDPDINTAYFGGSYELIKIGNYPVGRFMLNIVALPLLVFLIPVIFIYLATKTFGVLRKSYALNALGFIFYFAGRILQGVFESAGLPHMQATISPLLIILSLLLIVIANNVEQLK